MPDTSGSHPQLGPPAGPIHQSLERLAGTDQVDFEIDFFARILDRNPGHLDVLRVHASNLSRKGLLAETLEVDRRWAEMRPDDPLAHYNLACSLALCERPDDAFQELLLAVEHGYRDFRHMRRDPDLRTVRRDPRFRRLMRESGEF